MSSLREYEQPNPA